MELAGGGLALTFLPCWAVISGYGRKNKEYYKDLHQQAYERFQKMLSFGESKREAIAAGTEQGKIFSFSTYQAYWKHTKYFLSYIKQEHPECTTLKSAKKYVNEWLQTRVDQGLSAWTVQLEAKAMGKLYGISQIMKTILNLQRGNEKILTEPRR